MIRIKNKEIKLGGVVILLHFMYKLSNNDVILVLLAALGVIAGLSGSIVKGKGSIFWNKLINRIPVISIILICALVFNYFLFLDKCIVPDLNDMSLSEAQQVLEDLGLNYKCDQNDDYSYIVIAQYPKSNEVVSKDTIVVLVTSQNEQKEDGKADLDYGVGFAADLCAVSWGDNSFKGTVKLIPNKYGEVPDIDNLAFGSLLFASGKATTDNGDTGKDSLTITENDSGDRCCIDFEVLLEGDYPDGEYVYHLLIIQGESIAAFIYLPFVCKAGKPTVKGYSSCYVEDGEIIVYEYENI